MFSFPFMLEHQLTFTHSASILEEDKISRQCFLSPLGGFLGFFGLRGIPAQLWLQKTKAEFLGLGAATAQGGQASKMHVCAIIL